MSEDWRPFGQSEEESANYEILLTDVPPFLREPLTAELTRHLYAARGMPILTTFLNAQLATGIDLSATAQGGPQELNFIFNARALGDREFLTVLDYMLSRFQSVHQDYSLTFEKILSSGRSAWAVGERLGKVGLVERVPAGVRMQVESTIESSGRAGEVLARAWANVHGFEPSDSAAYADSVRATEIASIAVVEPSNGDATLGTVLGQMKADGDWRLPLREHGEAPSAGMVIAMARTLWYGHRDRHGSADYSDVTHAEARSAVTLAATLVDWFTSGALARRP